MKNNFKTKITKEMTSAIMLVTMVLTSTCLFAQSGKLLYKGKYTVGNTVYDNGQSFSPTFGSTNVEIYEDHLEDHFCPYQFQGIQNGKRVYHNSGDAYTYYVDGNYNITVSFNNPMAGPFTCSHATIVYSKGKSTMPQDGNNGGGQRIHEGGGNNPTPTPTPTPTPQKTHKCGLCDGTGRVVETNGTSFGNTKYCSECRKTVPDNHYHTVCPSCKGKGSW